MGRYFNKTRTPLAATTTKGRGVSFPSRGWAYVPIDEESSQGIQTYLRKGMLARADAVEDLELMAKLNSPGPVAVPVSAPIHVPVVISVVAPVVEADTEIETVASTETEVSEEVSDPDAESVASTDGRSADSFSRKPRRR